MDKMVNRGEVDKVCLKIIVYYFRSNPKSLKNCSLRKREPSIIKKGSENAILLEKS